MTHSDRIAIVAGITGLTIVLTVGCGKGAAPAQQRGPGEAVPVEVAQVVSETMPLDVHAIGNVVPSSTVGIKAQVGGLLQEVHFKEGQEVRRGQVLFTIDPRPFENDLRQAQAQLARDRAQLANAEADLARYRELVRDDFVTKEQFDQAKATAAALRATVQQDKAAIANAQVNLDYCTITAPISGRTGELLVHAGNVVKANDSNPLVVINRIQPVDVTFSVPEQRLDAIRRRHDQGKLAVTAYPAAESAAGVKGVLELIDNTVDVSTGTILLKGRFANRDEALWPGQFVDVVLTLGVQTGAVVIPTRAVQSGQQGDFVFVVGANDQVESRPITIDRTAGQETVVSSGVSPGETVVTQGQLRLTQGTTITVRSPTPASGGTPTPTPAGPPA
ncbi:MAG: efflux RND transporter periplasmic adaptor subunit [Deinococcales bacterium]